MCDDVIIVVIVEHSGRTLGLSNATIEQRNP